MSLHVCVCCCYRRKTNKQTNKQTKHTQACWIVNNELKGSEVPAQFSSFPSNRLCLTPKFCINYDYKILAGGLHHPTTFENNNSCKIWEGKQSKKKNRGKWQWLTLLLSFCSLMVASTRVCNLFPSWSVKDFIDSYGRKKTTAKYVGCSLLTALKFCGRLFGKCENCGLKESLFRQQQCLNIGSLTPQWRR